MMLTVVDDGVVVAEAGNSGAKSYVLKGISGPDLTRGIRRVWGLIGMPHRSLLS
jgi:DNA-binding NarL/FixJ family response regulator